MSNAPLRILFMGTPDFAVPALDLLQQQASVRGWEIVAVATQPDRPAGRGNQVHASPVAQRARALALPLLQPASLRKDPAAVAAIDALLPDLIVVAAYGLILPKQVLAIPRFGCINVHASLLPAYRGASPIAAALLDGLATTGNTIMLMDEGMDTGPALAQRALPIQPDDTTPALAARLAVDGAALLLETLPRWLAGEIAPIPQQELPGTPSGVRLIKKEAGQIDWTLPAVQIERMTRAYAPWPAAYSFWKGAPLKVLRARVIAMDANGLPTGSVVAGPAGIAVICGEGALLLELVQPAGKKAMDARSFANGAKEFVGSRLPAGL
jgi:methionyl-tRNA formyltransferase